MAAASDQIIDALAQGNAAYERRFGYIFIVCATGKSAGEMLDLLTARMQNDPVIEDPYRGRRAGENHRASLEAIER